MRRDLARLADGRFDLAVVGGGIYGVTIAREAALRGLSVALIEKHDFGGATSWNSHKIVHGGLRYLQSADLRRMRESICERSTWLRIAPHLVRPQAFLMPTYGYGLRGRYALRAALAINDVLSTDRNRGLAPSRHVPPGRMLSPAETLERAPGIDPSGLTGGAMWHDGLMVSSERLLIAVLRSAVDAGAEAANYVAVMGLRRGRAGAVEAVHVRDEVSGSGLEVRARFVINAGGPWTVGAALPGGPSPGPGVRLAKAMNLVVRKVTGETAIGVARRFAVSGGRMRTDRRLFFLVPWRDVTLAGTTYLDTGEAPDSFGVQDEEIETFLAEINAAYPPAELRREDVRLVHAGLVPVVGVRGERADVDLATRNEIRDHAAEGHPGVMTVTGVKFTTARSVAEAAIDLAAAALGRSFAPSVSAERPVYGGAIADPDALAARETRGAFDAASADVLRRLIVHHGDRFRDLLAEHAGDPAALRPIAEGAAATRAEVLHAVREEMAHRLSDVVLRRTDLGSAGHPGDAALAAAAGVMAKDLGWTPERTEAEIADVRGLFP